MFSYERSRVQYLCPPFKVFFYIYFYLISMTKIIVAALYIFLTKTNKYQFFRENTHSFIGIYLCDNNFFVTNIFQDNFCIEEFLRIPKYSKRVWKTPLYTKPTQKVLKYCEGMKIKDTPKRVIEGKYKLLDGNDPSRPFTMGML